jgi:Trk K+ transport system NAD-binding subunit
VGIVSAYSHALVDRDQRWQRLARLRLEAATGVELVEIDLAVGDRAVGKRLKEISLPGDCVIVAIQRGRRVVVPRGNTQLLAGDRVVALAGAGVAAGLRCALRGGAR